MSAEQHVGCALNEECVLHVASGMVGSEVHCSEHMPVVLDFRTFGESEPESREYVDNFGANERERMSGAESHGSCGAAHVDGYLRGTVVVERLAQGVDFLGGECLEFVEWSADSALFIGPRALKSLKRALISPFCSDILCVVPPPRQRRRH